MFAVRAAKLFSEYGLWRGGLQSAGRSLVAALGSPQEDLRSIAGMLLVRGGAKARPLLMEALRKRENVPMVLSVLADAAPDDPAVLETLRRHADDPEPAVADAARQALRVLEFRSATKSG